MGDDPLLELLTITKALADENRLRILAMLQHGELCVCQIIAMLNIAPSTISKHLFILRQAGLIASRKEGRWLHYRLCDRDGSRLVKTTLRWFLDAISDDPQQFREARRLKAILKIEPEVLCCQQRAIT